MGRPETSKYHPSTDLLLAIGSDWVCFLWSTATGDGNGRTHDSAHGDSFRDAVLATPSLTPEPTTTQTAQTAKPELSRTPTPTMESQPVEWLVYQNEGYGFSVRHPANWTLVELLERRQIAFTPGSAIALRIFIKFAVEDVNLVRTGVSAGDFESEGTVTFLGEPVEKDALVFQGKAKAIFYDKADEIRRGDVVFVITLESNRSPYEAIDIPADIQAMADEIVESFTWIGDGPSTPLPTATPAPLAVPPPLPGWDWSEYGWAGYAYMRPQAWSYGGRYADHAYISPETNSQIFVSTKPYAAEIEANSSWRGYPAQLEVDEGGGGSRFEVVFTIVGDNRTFTLHFFSASPWPEAELQIYRTLIETFMVHGATEEGIDIPLDWETETNETGYSIEAAVQEVIPEAGILVLTEPVQGFITITLAPDGQLLTEDGTVLGWEDIAIGAQVRATGEVGEAGTLMAQAITILAAEDNNGDDNG